LKMKRFIIRCAILVLITFLTIVGLSYLQPLLYKKLPSDYNRHLVLMDVLNEENETENIIFMGDSRSMFGVDTRIVKQELNASYEIFNLSSVGQSIFEASYYYALLKSNTKAVIQCTSPSFFTEDATHELPDEKAMSMYLSGYRINDEVKLIIENYNDLFNYGDFRNYLNSLSYSRSYIHSMIRPLFDNETFDESVRLSKYFPHIYTTNQHPDYPVYKCDCNKFKMKNRPETQLAFLKRVNYFLEKKGIVYIIVFMPVNPDECSDSYNDFLEYGRMIEQETGVKVLNISKLILDRRFFYDATHVNKEGAKIISLEISRQMLIEI